MSRIRSILSKFLKGLFTEQNARIVGEDHLGNRYFEKDPDPKKERRGARWVESPGQEKDASFIPELPTEWESWLRRKRDKPPTQEELDRNYAMMVRTQQRTKKLEQKYKQDSNTDNSTEAPYTETITQDSFKRKFPQFEDYEIAPGESRKKDDQSNK